jgi:hypothetical protein
VRGSKRGARAWTWPENARTWVRPRRGDRGLEVRDGLTSGDGGAERESGHGEKNEADSSGPRDRERERERERERGSERAVLRRHMGPSYQTQGARGLG